MKIMGSSPITSWQIDGETMETVTDFIFLGFKITADSDFSLEIKRCLLCGRKAMTNLESILKSRDITLPTKVHLVKATVFPAVMWMWELDYKESQAPKNWCFWTASSPLDCKEIKPINPKENQSWILIGRIDAEADAPVYWPPDMKSWLIGKDPDAGKDWRQEEKGTIEGEMFGWHHQLSGHAPWVGDGQGSLACCSPWGHKESDMTEWLNWTDSSHIPLSSSQDWKIWVNIKSWCLYVLHCCYCSIAMSCLTLCDPMDYSPWGSSVHGISQARLLE